MNNKLLPQKLKELRKINNYTQDYVAEVLGVVRQTYSHYETGKRTPDAEALYKLAGLYNISIDDLMHLTMNVDRNISYDAPVPTQSSTDLAEYLEFFNDPANKKKYQFNTNLEREMLFYFDKISEEDKKEIIEFTKIKARKPLYKLRLASLLFLSLFFFTPACEAHAYFSRQACAPPSPDVRSPYISDESPHQHAVSPIRYCHKGAAFLILQYRLLHNDIHS